MVIIAGSFARPLAGGSLSAQQTVAVAAWAEIMWRPRFLALERVRHIPPLAPVELEIVKQLATLAKRFLGPRHGVVTSGNQLVRDLKSHETVAIVGVLFKCY